VAKVSDWRRPAETVATSPTPCDYWLTDPRMDISMVAVVASAGQSTETESPKAVVT
jgi:hypothetical protein